VERLKRHPLVRALRLDKVTIAGLQATLLHYRRGEAEREVPVWRMIAAPAAELAGRAGAWAARLQAAGIAATTEPAESAIGGGSLPGETLPTTVLAVPTPGRSPDGAAAALRRARPPVICRIERDRLLFDPRTVLPEQDEALLAAVRAALVD